MSTSTFEGSLLGAIDIAFKGMKHDTAEHLVLALLALESRSESKVEALYKAINALPSAKPIRGFFPHKLSLQENYLPLRESSGLRELISIHSKVQKIRKSGGEIGVGPSLFECRVTYDRRLFSYHDEKDPHALHIRTVFYFEGDNTLPAGNYFRSHERGWDGNTMFDILIQPGGKWLDPRHLPVEEIYGYSRRKQDTSKAVPGLVNAFLLAFKKDTN